MAFNHEEALQRAERMARNGRGLRFHVVWLNRGWHVLAHQQLQLYRAWHMVGRIAHSFCYAPEEEQVG